MSLCPDSPEKRPLSPEKSLQEVNELNANLSSNIKYPQATRRDLEDIFKHTGRKPSDELVERWELLPHLEEDYLVGALFVKL